ncbi:unnamed protein product [Strongylus vulgaris]|uniref:Lipid-binding serum glycoprotein N-terminal domain-containing protein n=1 Tax=Strongylus vulgaris TaxID=40348 RepID=A0A3P7L361_STRVU|nr:unnamed protein product [Strongylus vulgaris]
MSIRWLQLLLLTVGIVVFAKQNSNVKAQIYSSALEFLSRAVTHVVESGVNKFKFRDITSNIRIGTGTVKLTMHLEITKFKLPVFTGTIDEKLGSVFTSRGGILGVKGSWTGKYNFPFKTIPIDVGAWINCKYLIRGYNKCLYH